MTEQVRHDIERKLTASIARQGLRNKTTITFRDYHTAGGWVVQVKVEDEIVTLLHLTNLQSLLKPTNTSYVALEACCVVFHGVEEKTLLDLNETLSAT